MAQLTDLIWTSLGPSYSSGLFTTDNPGSVTWTVSSPNANYIYYTLGVSMNCSLSFVNTSVTGGNCNYLQFTGPHDFGLLDDRCHIRAVNNGIEVEAWCEVSNKTYRFYLADGSQWQVSSSNTSIFFCKNFVIDTTTLNTACATTVANYM
jgi:hypothetical protein